jgi:hypothetical protein
MPSSMSTMWRVALLKPPPSVRKARDIPYPAVISPLRISMILSSAHYPGLKKARIIPLWTAYLGLPFISIHERLSKKKPLYTVVSLKTIQTPADFDTSKAEKELGITFTPLKDTINRALDSIDKMQKDGLLK